MVQAVKFSVDPFWKMYIQLLGLNSSAILKYAQLPVDLFSRKDASLTAEEYFKLWNSLMAVSGDPLLPIKMIEISSPDIFHPVFFAALCSPNLNIALKRIQTYKRFCGPLSLRVIEKKESTVVEFDCLYKTDPLPDSLVAFEILYLLNIGRIGLRKKLEPLSITTTSDMLTKKEYVKFISMAPSKGSKNKLVFSARDANSPFITENHSMWSFFEPGLRKRLNDLDENISLAHRIEDLLFELLPSDLSSIEEVASRLGLSKRTLQRRLNSENTSFQDVLNGTREKLAHHYLKNSLISCEEISFLLGYEDPNSFIRAYKSWSGNPPGNARIALRRNENADLIVG